MGLDVSSFLVLGFEVSETDFLEERVDAEETCPNGHAKGSTPFCGECGGQFSRRSRNVATAVLKYLLHGYEEGDLPTTWHGVRDALFIYNGNAVQSHDDDDATWVLGTRILETRSHRSGSFGPVSMSDDRLIAEIEGVQGLRDSIEAFKGRTIRAYICSNFSY